VTGILIGRLQQEALGIGIEKEMMKNNNKEEQDNWFTLRRYSSKSDNGEGCEGNEGST
jgi:hypothetical protein